MSPEDKPEPRELFNCVQRTRLSHWIHQESSGNDFWLHASFEQQFENCIIMAKVNVTRGQARTQGIVQLCPKNTFVTLDSPGELRKWFLIARKFWTTIWELHNYGKSECHQRTSPNPGNCSTVSKEHVCHIGFTRRAQEMISDCTQVLNNNLRSA